MTQETNTSLVTRAPFLPGLALCVGVAVIAVGAIELLELLDVAMISPVFVAIAIGLLIGNIVSLPDTLRTGFAFAMKRVLRLAIILLGIGFSLSELWNIGAPAALAIAVIVIAAFALAIGLSRIVGVDPRVGVLIGAGTAICGNSAIVATAPLVDAREEDIAFASATITLFGTVAMLGFPALALLLDLSAEQVGTLAGLGVHDSAQSIAAGFLHSITAGEHATLVKLTRTAFLVPILGVLTVAHLARTRAARAASGSPPLGFVGVLKTGIPWFAVGFVVLAAVRTLGDRWLDAAEPWTTIVSLLRWSATFLIVVAMAAVGLQTRFSALRSMGVKAFSVGLFCSLAVAAIALAFSVNAA